ncbi:hypothetical protein FPHOBKDP_00174 [Listeria phage LPJP1]|nr:hypothetical protein FPHOBKDP_00174 [Listeria phage LPJP1]
MEMFTIIFECIMITIIVFTVISAFISKTSFYQKIITKFNKKKKDIIDNIVEERTIYNSGFSEEEISEAEAKNYSYVDVMINREYDKSLKGVRKDA